MEFLTNNRQKSPISATISRWWDECSHFPLSFTLRLNILDSKKAKHLRKDFAHAFLCLLSEKIKK